jgi:glutaredoxin
MYYEFHSDRAARNEFARQYAAGHGTIPMVFHNGRFVGGYAQLQEYMKKK